jgi:ADP-ribosylarginine hydrolase
MEYYFENFSNNKKVFFPGAGADDVIIIAYDCLIMSKNNFEKLVFMSMINVGDTDTIGTIAAAWYGSLYGFENVPQNLLLDKKYDEYKLFAEKLSEKYDDKNIDFF